MLPRCEACHSVLLRKWGHLYTCVVLNSVSVEFEPSSPSPPFVSVVGGGDVCRTSVFSVFLSDSTRLGRSPMDSSDILLDMVGRFAKCSPQQHSSYGARDHVNRSAWPSGAAASHSFSAADVSTRSPPIDTFIASNDDEHRLEQQFVFLEESSTPIPVSDASAAERFYTKTSRVKQNRMTGEELLRQRWGLPPAFATPVVTGHQQLTSSTASSHDPQAGFNASIEAVRSAMVDVRTRPSVRQILDGHGDANTWNAQRKANASSAPAENALSPVRRRISVRDGVERTYLDTLKALHVDDVFHSICAKEKDTETTGVRLHESDLPLLPMSVIRYRMRCATLWRRRCNSDALKSGAADSAKLVFPTPPIGNKVPRSGSDHQTAAAAAGGTKSVSIPL